MKTFNSFSFGCRVNMAEKEALDRELIQKGYIKSEKNPDVYILNTCSVTHKAEREAKQHIYQIRRKYPEVKIVVTGCAATNWIKTKTQVEEVDYIVDNQNKEFMADLLEKKYAKKAHSVRINPAFDTPVATDTFTRSGRAIIKIQDGCNRFCTFCIVPYLRGLPKSVPIDELVTKVKQFSRYPEVILTAINTNAYGYDTKESFTDLLKQLFTETDIPRFSFGSIHPWSIDEEFLSIYKQYKDSKRFVHFFHIPLQAGSDNMLRLMKRNYTRQEFIEKLHAIAEINPFAFIGTDVIVGFLEESDQDFEDTYTFLKDTPISKFHVFRYSTRQHTAAYYLGKRLKKPSPEVAKKRSEALRQLSDMKYKQFQAKHINNTFEALLLERRKDNYQLALLENQMPAYIETKKDMTGELKRVTITELKTGNLVGRVV